MNRLVLFFCYTFVVTFLVLTANVNAQKYTGIWREDIRKDRILIGARWERFESERRKLADKKFYVVDVETELRDGIRYYTGVWHAGGKPPKLWTDLTAEILTERVAEYQDADGLGLIDVEVYQRDDRMLYMGIWRDIAQDQELLLSVPWPRFKRQNDAFRADGFQLMDIEILKVNDQWLYTGLWQKTAAEFRLWHDVDWDCFRTIRSGLHDNGFRLVDIEIYEVNGQRKFSAIWHPGGGTDRLWILESGDIFVKKWKEFELDNYWLIDLDVNEDL